jgi:O-antigen/teichoic acid export membrane protein
VILQALGVVDYGIYNVVGGVVSMFSILSGSLSASIQRYITYELGKGGAGNPSKVFSTSINTQLILIVLVLILLETIGLWFLHYKMVIPEERFVAANWVFQFSIITFCVNLWSIPYNAAIIAHEKMSAFAYISIFEAIARLAICYLVIQSVMDRLIFYAFLMLVVGLLIRFLYGWYCKKHFEECRYRFVLDKKLLKEIFAFSGWNVLGAASSVLNAQGVNLLLNVFFGPVVNAARGISISVSNAVVGFVNNFMTALNPQITKNYAAGNFEYTLKLVFQGARFSYYILLILCLPIIITTPYLLHLWLGNVPENAFLFTRLVLVFSLTEVLGTPLVTLMLANGNIRNYQIVVGGLQLLNLPVGYLILKLGGAPYTVFVVAIGISVISELARIIMLQRMMPFPGMKFLKDVIANVLLISFLASAISYAIYVYWGLSSFGDFVFLCGCSAITTCIIVYFIGCSLTERRLIKDLVFKFVKKKV